MSKHRPNTRNRLLSFLSDDDSEVMFSHLEPVDLPRDYEIAAVRRPISHYYFVETGIGSIVNTSSDGFKVEVGLVGRDGILPTAAILQCDEVSSDVFIQVAGHGLRIEADALKGILAEHPLILKLMLRFVQTLMTQTACTALSNVAHHIDERLARWLLMCHDRVDGDQLALTHEYISVLLGVRRPSVTTALHVLEGNRLIYSTRGNVIIRDREALEQFAADAYGVPEEEYSRLIGPLRTLS
jgi:CRP-like cAMP-binding protein